MRLIDADEVRKRAVEVYQGNGVEFETIMMVPLSAIDNAPSMDAEKIVFCKDCRHRDPEDKKCDCGCFERQGCDFPVADDYFCKFGARRYSEIGKIITAYTKGFDTGVETVRQRGEWSITNETDEFYGRVYKCTHCGKEMLACGCRNFCTWCGADMRGNKE